MKKILVTGANGLLGQHLVHSLLEKGYDVAGTGRGENRVSIADSYNYRYYAADITNDLAMQAIMEKEQPHTIVHAAAMTQLDECQLNQEQCEQTNVHATAQLLLSAEQHSRHFIYVSTDFVFDGSKSNYAEEDAENPISWYAFSKVQAEALVQTAEIPFTIVRTSLVYGHTAGGTRSNIVSWVKQSLETGKRIKVVADQWRTPTYVGDLVNGIILTIEKSATGIYHISGKDVLTPYDIALQTAAVCKLDEGLIEKVDASTFTQPAKRPPNTTLNISKAQRQLGYAPLSFTEGLKKYLCI